MNKQESGNLDWERVYDGNRRPLLLYARQWVGTLADAEDVLQEAFVKVFQRKEQSESVLPLLYKAVKWCAIDLARRRERRSNREIKAAVFQEEEAAMFESGLEDEERRMAIEKAMKVLPAEQNEVLVMKIWGDLTFQQIADALDIPPGTAASRYRYALDALREEMKPGASREI